MNARELFAASAPVHPEMHFFDDHVLLANGSRVYALGEGARARLESGDLELAAPPYIGEHEAPVAPPLRAISLAIAQKCNLGCTYCYAQQGEFGGTAKNMPAEVALRAVELLFREAGRGDRVNLSFLGGEPLFNRPVLQAATLRARELARERGAQATFSITTNGTLLREEDAEFFEAHAFSVTVSVDGIGEVHDRLRPAKSGRGTFDALVARVTPLLQRQRAMQVSARVTVTPHNLALRETLDALIGLGFHSVGFSPMLRSPSGNDELSHDDLAAMLDQMIDCGRELERAIVDGRRYPFANGVNALREIHRGTHRPYPCGAGAGYAGVSADGELAACHRFVGDADGAMGDVASGIDRARQEAWLGERHVHRQEPCNRCWARYLCGGGCHHEVIRRGRPACDYIRGWLHYSLGAYVRLLAQRPEWFGDEPS
ncbi:MAG TPA: radical SAM protein [Thermoanaerobaculia bacterium]|nr:radical SAM protein [Thermoanaerobaculia bacterium]